MTGVQTCALPIYLEERLQLYATAVNLLALENAALTGREAGTARIRVLPRHRRPVT